LKSIVIEEVKTRTKIGARRFHKLGTIKRRRSKAFDTFQYFEKAFKAFQKNNFLTEPPAEIAERHAGAASS
jgi:hypothetical protein